MIIGELFEKPINTDIKSVIKADEITENIIYNELDEYVVTNKILSHFNTFFKNYSKSINQSTEKIGVWISGFFGSGKSHFLKILSYILNTSLKINGKSAAEVLIDSGKIREKSIIDNIKKSTSINNDVILINISSKSNKDSSILDVFYKEFNKICGYSYPFLYLANLERKLDKRNVYDKFKKEFELINGNSWDDSRDDFSEITDDIVKTLNNINFMSKDEAIRWVKNPELDLNITIETFAKEVNEYCIEQGNNHHLVFLVDEIGQYISKNKDLMLELQTIVENLGNHCSGNAWVVVTSQQSIKEIYEIDFSKIQGRFDTRLALSSAHVDEVIQKRLLEKNDEAKQTLELIYEESEGILNNLLLFNNSAEMKLFLDYNDFINFYPFIPYQFELIQKSLSLIRKNSSSGRDMSEGERSMIKIFNESLIKSSNKTNEFLVPFYYFYDSIQNDIDQEFALIIENAEKKISLNRFDINLLKTLFLIKFFKNDYFYPSIDNISTLMISKVNEDKMELKNKISKSLNKLVSETLVYKKDEIYYFLSDEEQDINREIKEELIEIQEILNKTFNIIFGDIYNDRKNFKLKNRYDFKFDRIIDNKQKRKNELGIRILTPFYEEESNQQTLDGSPSFSFVNPPKDEIIIDLREEITIFNQIKDNLQIQSYLNKNGNNLDTKLKCEKQKEYLEGFDKIRVLFEESIINAKIQINGNNFNVSENNIVSLFDNLLTKLINEVYYNLNHLDFEPDSKDIENAIKTNLDEEESRCSLALNDLKIYISEINKIKIGEVYSKYLVAPYGYTKNDIAWLITTLFSKKKISLFINNQELLLEKDDSRIILNYIKNYKSVEAQNLFLTNREEIPLKDIKIVKNIYEDLFDEPLSSKNEEKVMFIFKEWVSSENDKIDKYVKCIKRNKFYPGLEILEKNKTLFNEVKNKNTLNAFYSYVVDNKDLFYENYEDLEEVYAFFNGPQKEIFDNSCHKYDVFNDNKIAIDSQQLTNISDDIFEIISDKSPFNKISHLSNLNKEFDGLFNDILKKERDPVLKIIENDQKYLINLLTKEDIKLKNDIEKDYNHLESNLKNYINIRRIQGCIQDSNDLKNKFMKKISNSESKKSILINLNTIFNDELEIENEDDMEKFLDEIRKNVKNELIKEHIVKIRL